MVQPATPTPPRRNWAIGVAAAAVAATIVMAYLLVRASGPASLPAYHLLTYRRGAVRMARFVPDGQTIVYSAAWEGRPVEVFSTRVGTPEALPVGVPGAEIMAVLPLEKWHSYSTASKCAPRLTAEHSRECR